MTTSVCRACGSPIEYGVLVASGRSIVLDAGRFADGVLEVDHVTDGGAIIVRLVPLALRTRSLLRPHDCRNGRR
jgi:hypothetical protein